MRLVWLTASTVFGLYGHPCAPISLPSFIGFSVRMRFPMRQLSMQIYIVYPERQVYFVIICIRGIK